MAREVINNSTLVCDDDTLIKAHTKVIRDVWVPKRKKQMRPTERITLEVENPVTLFLAHNI